MAWMDLEWLCKAEDSQVLDSYGNATRRTGVERLRRNAVIILHNEQTSKANELLKWLKEHAKDTCSAN